MALNCFSGTSSCVGVLAEPKQQDEGATGSTAVGVADVMVASISGEEAASTLGLSVASSYAQRRSALIKAALTHSARLGALLPEEWTSENNSSQDFMEAWVAFNSLVNRRVRRDDFWGADDMFPQLESAERPEDGAPMPRLLSAACLEARVESGGLAFVCQLSCATRQSLVMRNYADLAELDGHLRTELGLEPPPLPANSAGGPSLAARLFGASRRDSVEPDTMETARQQVDDFLRFAVSDLRDKGKYSEKLFDLLDLDAHNRKKLHCDDVKLVLREIFDIEALPLSDTAEDFAVSVEWHEAWLAYLRSDTDYYGPPGKIKNADLAAVMAQHAIGPDPDVDIADHYSLHSPIKWTFVQLVYGQADLPLRIPRRRASHTT